MIPRPRIRPTVPPGVVPGERRTSWKALLDKPTSLPEAGIVTAGPLAGPLVLDAIGAAPLEVVRDEGTAPVAPALDTLIKLRRGSTVIGFLAADANDHVVIVAKNGTTGLAEFDTDGTQNFAEQLLRDAAAAVLPFLAIKRQSTVIGYLGTDASDNLAFIAADGTTVLAWLTSAGELDALLRAKAPHLEASTDVKTPKVLDGSGTQVVAAQQAAVANASTSAASGSTATGSISHASSDPVPKADYDVLVDKVNTIITAQSANATAINSVVSALNAEVAQLNALLARLRTHGLIAP